jgi:hypothetical protein
MHRRRIRRRLTLNFIYIISFIEYMFQDITDAKQGDIDVNFLVSG